MKCFHQLVVSIRSPSHVKETLIPGKKRAGGGALAGKNYDIIKQAGNLKRQQSGRKNKRGRMDEWQARFPSWGKTRFWATPPPPPPVSFNDNKTPRGGAQFSRYYGGSTWNALYTRDMCNTESLLKTPKNRQKRSNLGPEAARGAASDSCTCRLIFPRLRRWPTYFSARAAACSPVRI